MNFKPALCPSCGGNLQVPDNLNTIKCMYCGVDVIVKNAIQLAGRVKEFTSATTIEKVNEWKPFDVDQMKTQTKIILSIMSLFGIIMSLYIGSSNTSAGLTTAIIILVFLFIIFIIRSTNIAKIQKADEEMKNKPQTVTLLGYKGQCPYCDTSVTLTGEALGYDCPACHRRIVIRDSKFYSVDTPISGIK